MEIQVGEIWLNIEIEGRRHEGTIKNRKLIVMIVHDMALYIINIFSTKVY